MWFDAGGLGGASKREGYRLMSLGVEAEETLESLDGLFTGLVAVTAHLSFGVAAHVVGIGCEQACVEVSAGSAQAAEPDLERQARLDASFVEGRRV